MNRSDQRAGEGLDRIAVVPLDRAIVIKRAAQRAKNELCYPPRGKF